MGGPGAHGPFCYGLGAHGLGVGSRAWNARTGFLAALVLATGLEFCVMSRLMLTDVPLAFFLAAALFAYWMAGQGEERRNFWVALSIACNGLAVLTKGPIGSLVVWFATLAFGFLAHRKTLYRGSGLWWGLALYAAIVVPWYAAMFAWHAKPSGRNFSSATISCGSSARNIQPTTISGTTPACACWVRFRGCRPWCWPFAAPSRGFRDDPAVLFQWCWLLTSLVFLTVAQSKLPSYGFFLFVPLAVIVGRSLDLLLERGFASLGERRLVVGFAVFQCVTVLVMPFIKAAKAFTFPIALVAICLVVGLVFLLQKRLVVWLLTSAAASLALLAGALTKALPAVEAESSARPVALALLRERRADEPLVSGKFLVRGIIYYVTAKDNTRQPVTILASKAHPFWADHPLPIIVGSKGLRTFAAQHPSFLCGLRKSDWRSVADEKVFARRDAFSEEGENVIVRGQQPVIKSEPTEEGAKPAKPPEAAGSGGR